MSEQENQQQEPQPVVVDDISQIQAFNEAAQHVAVLTPKEKARLRAKARRKQIRLKRKAAVARSRQLEARRQARIEAFRKAHPPQPFGSFVFSPGLKVASME